MKPQSLLIILTNPPQIRAQETLLNDYVSTEMDGIPVFASVAPWNPMHDLLVDRETQTLAGIVYPVATAERAAIAAICESLPAQVVRYCVSPARAAALLRDQKFQLTKTLSEIGNPSDPVKQFPEALRAHRQNLRACLMGQYERELLPQEVLPVAGEYFQEIANAEHLLEWTSGGDVARVEVTWVKKPVHEELPSYFPSAFEIELAQYFAEDIWFYREDNKQVYAIGFNHLQATLDVYDLKLPMGLL